MSAPDMKAVPPAPAKSSAFKSSRASSCASSRWSSSTMVRFSAFRTSGRLKVTSATPSRSSTRIVR